VTEPSGEAVLLAIRNLIDQWCDERRLPALARVLPMYVAFNGLTDGWAELCGALKAARALGHEAFSAANWERLNDLIRATERVAYRISD